MNTMNKKTDIFDQIGMSKERIDELRNEGISDEMIQFIKHEHIGRMLTSDIDIFNIKDGKTEKIPLFQAMLIIGFTRDIRIITENIRPAYDIKNEYMGFFENGKIRDVKKEKMIKGIKYNILRLIGIIAALVIGLKAPLIVLIAFVVFAAAWGYISYSIGSDNF